MNGVKMLASHAKWQHGAWRSTFTYDVKPVEYISIELSLIAGRYWFKCVRMLLTRCRWLIGTTIE